MDPRVRRDIWNLILRMKHDRITIMTTHSMEEADILGDKIAIMANGQLRCTWTKGQGEMGGDGRRWIKSGSSRLLVLLSIYAEQWALLWTWRTGLQVSSSSKQSCCRSFFPGRCLLLTATDPHPPPPPPRLLGYKIELVVKHDSTQTIMDLVSEKLPGTSFPWSMAKNFNSRFIGHLLIYNLFNTRYHSRGNPNVRSHWSWGRNFIAIQLTTWQVCTQFIGRLHLILVLGRKDGRREGEGLRVT